VSSYLIYVPLACSYCLGLVLSSERCNASLSFYFICGFLLWVWFDLVSFNSQFKLL
jgi:hypothetical protein